MSITLRFSTVLMVAMLTGIASPLFAESAPVYDVDAVQQEQSDMPPPAEQAPPAQDLPPPPPEQQESAFVPVTPPPAAASSQQPASRASVASTPTTSGMTLEQRMHHLEQQMNGMQPTETNARLESLQSQVQSLRSQLEQLTHQFEQLQAQMKMSSAKPTAKKVSTDTDSIGVVDNGTDMAASEPAKASGKIVAKQSAKAVTPNVPVGIDAASKSDEGQPNVAEEQQIYQTAYNFIKAKKYNEAVDALQGMLKKYPSGQFASNAHYWLGELYGLMGKNDLALIEFDTVVKNYPSSPRISDAQLKVGLIYSAQSKWTEAKTVFKKVINRYPGTASSRVASEQLKQIKLAGH